MKELRKLIKIAKAELSKAISDAKTSEKEGLNNSHVFYDGKAAAFDFIITEAELLLAQKPGDNVPPQLQQHDVVRCKELLEQMYNEEQKAYVDAGTDYLKYSEHEYNQECIRCVLLLLNKETPAL